MDEAIRVPVGDRNVTVEPFSTRRTTYAFRVVAGVFRRYRDLGKDIAQFRREYETENPIRVSREQAERLVAHHAGLAAEADEEDERVAHEAASRRWQAMLDGSLKDRPYVELPGEPSIQETVVHVLPKAMENAEEEITRLLGLIVISNTEFGEARRQKKIDPSLMIKGDEILDGSTPDEALDLLFSGAELFLGDVQARKEKVGKLRKLVETVLRPASEQETVEGTAEEDPAPSTSSPSPTSESDTDSDAPTDGPSSTPSTGSPSERPQPSLS
jgi:hypothetical protein